MPPTPRHPIAERLGLDSRTTDLRLELADLSPPALRELATHGSEAAQRLDPVFDRFYDQIARQPELAPRIADPALLSRLRRAQRANAQELFSPGIDRDYVEGRLRVGVRHFEIRLVPQWYLTGHGLLLADLVDDLLARGATTAAKTLIRRAFFDMSLALDAYEFAVESNLHQAADSAEPGDAHPNRDALAPGASGSPSDPGRGLAAVRLSTENSTLRREFLGLGAAEVETLHSLGSLFERAVPLALDAFYALISSHPETRRMVPPPVAARLRQQVRSYWLEITTGAFDRPYAASRLRIGMIHERIGLAPQFYLAGLARQLCDLVGAIVEERQDARRCVRALLLAVMFDVSFAIDAYMEARIERLLRSDGYAASLVASLTAGVAVLDEERRIVSVNHSLLELLQLDAELLHRMPADQALPLAELGPLLDRLRREPGKRASTLVRHRDRTLRMAAVRLDATTTGVASTAAGHVALVLDDVTELRQLGAGLDEDQRLAQLAVEEGPTALWAVELPTWTTISASPQLLALTGRRDVGLVGRAGALLECVSSRDLQRFRAEAEALETGASLELEIRLRHVDGSEVWVRSRLRRVVAGTRDVVVGTWSDASAARGARARSLDELGRLAGGVAHEINNALTAVMVELGMMRDGETDARRSAAHALDACDHAAEVTRRLLAFARRQPLRPVEIDLRAHLGTEREALAHQLAAGQTLALDVDGPPLAVRVDPGQLRTALLQLVANAREAMHDGGTVTVRCRPFGATRAEIAVIDTGSGMAEDVQARAFEPFFSADQELGTGLGLSMVLGFARQSGGEASLESTLGRGTTVRLMLPRVESSAPTAQPDGAEQPFLLVVDDHDLVRQAAVQAARALGLTAIGVASAAQALETLAARTVDAVLSGVVLGPGLDGIGLAEEIRRSWPDMPVVLMSGYLAGHFEGEPHFGRYPFLAKPFTPSQLRSTLASVIPLGPSARGAAGS